MKVLISTLFLCGTLSVLAGAAMAGKVVPLNCQSGECQFSEELGPSQTHEYRGFCAEKNSNEFTMVCHAVKGTTCTGANGKFAPNYWTCTCTNWSPTKRKYVTIDLLCND